MIKQLPENKMLINQLALAALKRENFLPEPDMLYCLQAAEWAMDNGLLEVWKQVSYELSETLDFLMCRRKPAAVMLWLEGEHDLLSDFENMNPDASEMAVVVLNQLHSRLTAELEGYPI